MEMELAEKRRAYAYKRDFVRKNIGYVVGDVDDEQWRSAAERLEDFARMSRELLGLQIDMRQLRFGLETEKTDQSNLPLVGGAA
jgi:hypothetical protein